MKKLIPLLFFFIPALSHANVCGTGTLKTVFNPFTNKLDYVCVAAGSTPVFSIASFTDNQSATVEMGVGVWESTGNITFTASYSNGPATSGTVTFSGWSSGLILGNTFQGPTASTASVSYPGAVGGTVVFTLNAAGALGSASASITHTFNNDRYWGISTVTSGYALADLQALGSSDLTNSIPNVFTVNPAGGQYIVYSYPSRLGTASFSVGGFPGGFLGPETDSITNGSGFTENYYTYHSTNQNLGLTTVTVTTP
jgi:hypothetical protein